MQDFTNEEEFQRIEQLPAERIVELKAKFARSPYKQTFHLQPPFGSAGKPNGLIYENHRYLISHEWYPFAINNGLSYSYAYQSHALNNFTTESILLKPDSAYDHAGIKGGSAIEINNHLNLIYTGKSDNAENEHQLTQLMAIRNQEQEMVKQTTPIQLDIPEGYKDSLQDAKVFNKEGQRYALISAQTDQSQGRLLVYNANHIDQWQLLGPLYTNLSNFGRQWHAPDYFMLNGYDFIMFTTESTEQHLRAGYILGQLNFNDFKMNHGDFKLWDDGFGLVYPQTLVGKHGERILIGLLTTEGDYENLSELAQVPCLSLPRQLSMQNGKLYQQPHPSLKALRYNKETALGYANKFAKQLHPYEGSDFELNIDILENDATEIYFEVKVSRFNSTKIIYNTHSRLVTLDCSESGEVPLNDAETKCSVQLSQDLEHLQIFLDQSSIEVFCNHGERVMSSRIFPPKNSTGIRVGTESGQAYLQFTKYDLHSIYETNSEED